MLNLNRLFVAAFLLSLTTLASSVARADVIPKGLVQGDTLTVLYIDLTKADPVTLRKTAAAIVGEDALKKAAWFDSLLKHNEGLAKAGVTGGGIVWSGPRGEFYPKVEMMAFLNLKPGVDAAAAAEAAEAHLPKANVIFPISDTELLFVPDRTNPPEEEQMKDHAKRAVFEKHLAGLGEAAVKVVVMSSDAAAKEYERPDPKPNHSWGYDDGYLVQRALRHKLASTNLITLAATAGAEPKVRIAIEAKTPKAAVELEDEHRVTILGVRGLRSETLERLGYEDPDSFVMLPVLRALRPQVKENTNLISIDLSPAALKALGPQLLLGMEQKAEARKEQLISLQIRGLMNEVALHMLGGNDFPDSFEDLRQSIGDARLDYYLKHPRTGEKVGFRWIKPAVKKKDLKDASGTMVIPDDLLVVVELRDGKVVEDGWRGYFWQRTAKGPIKRETPKK